MSAVQSCLGTGEIFVEMQEARARYVRPRVLSPARFVIREIVPTVTNDPLRIVEVTSELVCRYERREHPLIICYKCGWISRRTNSWKCRMPSSSGDW